MDPILRQKRKARSRLKTRGSAERPRVAVYRSLSRLYLQIIDDQKGVTLLAGRTAKVAKKQPKTEQAFSAGKELAGRALAAGIRKVVFDRSGYRYHGRVKAGADGLRAGGLEF